MVDGVKNNPFTFLVLPLKQRAMQHTISLYPQLVQFEDVDAAGVVHHPLYLYYLERARCQSLLAAGCSIKKIMQARLGIVVAAIEMKYLRPLFLHEEIYVASQLDSLDGPLITMTQVIVSDPSQLPKATLKDELRNIKGLRFFAHLKLAVVSMDTMQMTSPPDWLTKGLGA